jgi:hypothetical protein
MDNKAILAVPLNEVMRSEIALPLQYVLRIYTVGSFLHAWANPRNHKSIEQIFQTPQQARHAAAVCAAWLGIRVNAAPQNHAISQWWISDEPRLQPLQ